MHIQNWLEELDERGEELSLASVPSSHRTARSSPVASPHGHLRLGQLRT